MTELVFIPGHLCGAWLYQAQWQALEGRARCRLADVTQDDSIGAMAERMLAEMPTRAVLVGLSMGAMVAMEAMARAPERVSGACLIATDPTPARDVERAWRAGERRDVAAHGVAGYAARFSAKSFGHDADVAARLGFQVAAEMATVPADVFNAQSAALDARRDMVPLIAGCSTPVEVVVGSEDRVCPPRLHPGIAAACSQACLTELPRVGHLATLEAPEACSARITALLERISS